MKKVISLALASMMVLSMLTGCSSSAESTEVDVASWPDKTINIYTGTAGGDTDFSARAMAAALERYYDNGITFNVINQSGSTAGVAVESVMNEDPGYAIYHRKNDDAIAVITGVLEESPTESLKVVACIGQCPGYLLVVNKDLGVSTIEELIALAQEQPGAINYGTALGSYTQVITNVLEYNMGIEFNKVDGEGTAQRAVSLLGGHLQATTLTYSAAEDYLISGDFIALGCFDTVACPYYDIYIPTFAEQGYDMEFPTVSYYWAMHPDTSDELVEGLDEAIQWIMENDTEYADLLMESYDMTPYYMSGEDFVEYFDYYYPIIEELLALDA